MLNWLLGKEKKINEEDLKRAKELFFKYDGSHFQMFREGEFSEYEKYNISKQQEKLWYEERINSLIEKINDENANVINDLIYSLIYVTNNSRNTKGVEFILNWARRLTKPDTFTKILLAEQMINTLKVMKKDICLELSGDVTNFIFNMIQRIDDQNITVDSYYRAKKYLEKGLNNNELVGRVLKLKEWCSKLN